VDGWQLRKPLHTPGFQRRDAAVHALYRTQEVGGSSPPSSISGKETVQARTVSGAADEVAARGAVGTPPRRQGRMAPAFRAEQGGDQPGRMRVPRPKQVSEQGTVSRSRMDPSDRSWRPPDCHSSACRPPV
jgi:hypothetical protein